LILTGTVGFIIWRFFEAFTDPYEYGKTWKGKMKGTGIALSVLPDILLVYASVHILWSVTEYSLNGEPTEERAWARALVDQGQSWIRA
jgi:hypothetical protein